MTMTNEMMEAVAAMQAVAAVIEARERPIYLAAAGAEAEARKTYVDEDDEP